MIRFNTRSAQELMDEIERYLFNKYGKDIPTDSSFTLTQDELDDILSSDLEDNLIFVIEIPTFWVPTSTLGVSAVIFETYEVKVEVVVTRYGITIKHNHMWTYKSRGLNGNIFAEYFKFKNFSV